MRRFVLATVLGLSLTLGSTLGVAAADPVTVSYAGCVFGNGGSATVPADSAVSIRFGWSAVTKAQVESFLKAVTTYASVDGTSVASANSYFSSPAMTTGGWLTFWTYPTGRSLASGQSMTVTLNFYLSRKVPTGKDAATGRPLKAGPGFVWSPSLSCTVSGI
jgi:hypothetical protein